MGRVKCLFEASAGGGLIRFTMTLSEGGTIAGTLRRSRQSRRVRLIVDERGLTVTAPRAYPYKKELASLLERHLEWILKTLDRVRLRTKEAARYPVPLPGLVALPALGEEWRVEASDVPGRRAFAKEGVIHLPADFTRAEALTTLRTWLRLRAKAVLPPLLQELAGEQGLTVARVFIKDMRTRWGSCSSRRNVNLNARLLFLPPDLARHVMLHELCHLEEMNHSPAFYARLRAADPEADRHIAELRSAWRRVPAWASEPL